MFFLIKFSQTHLAHFICKRLTNFDATKTGSGIVYLRSTDCALPCLLCSSGAGCSEVWIPLSDRSSVMCSIWDGKTKISRLYYPSSYSKKLSDLLVMPNEYCKCLQLLNFKRAKSLAQESFLFLWPRTEQINIQSATGQKPWKRSKDQGIHPPVYCWVDFSFELIKNVDFLCALFLALPLPTRKQLSGHKWSQIFPFVVF